MARSFLRQVVVTVVMFGTDQPAEHVWKEQTDTIKKAKEINRIIREPGRETTPGDREPKQIVWTPPTLIPSIGARGVVAFSPPALAH